MQLSCCPTRRFRGLHFPVVGGIDQVVVAFPDAITWPVRHFEKQPGGDGEDFFKPRSGARSYGGIILGFYN